MRVRKGVGLLCLVLGGVAWPVGYALHYTMPQILPFHLAFIFAGLALRGSHVFSLLKQRLASREP